MIQVIEEGAHHFPSKGFDHHQDIHLLVVEEDSVYQRKVPASCRKLPSRFTSVRVVEVGVFRSKAL